MRWLAQAVTDGWARRGERHSLLGGSVGLEVRRRLLRLGDPELRYQVGRAELAMPLSHQLPYYRADHPESTRRWPG
jgi:hypothetical protein